jgi:hypothetical protein
VIDVGVPLFLSSARSETAVSKKTNAAPASLHTNVELALTKPFGFCKVSIGDRPVSGKGTR